MFETDEGALHSILNEGVSATSHRSGRSTMTGFGRKNISILVKILGTLFKTNFHDFTDQEVIHVIKQSKYD